MTQKAPSSRSLEVIIEASLAEERDIHTAAKRIIGAASQVLEPEAVPALKLKKGAHVYGRGSVMAALINRPALKALFGNPEGRQAIIYALADHYFPQSRRSPTLRARRFEAAEWLERKHPFRSYSGATLHKRQPFTLVR